ncbi:DEAD/DEAH box helicase family protein [Gottfriedia sp. NPDC057991]|uniref:TOTE conflict system archaeo-eukaryotic primase domain-containing protein n=1 Tax=Gottfriedia sp. NPDC057991 TaxID=3346298 RepID=UPI0036DD803F
MHNLELKIQQLIKECEQLKLENQKLKTLLKHHNIPLNSSNQNTKNESVNVKRQKINERIEIYKNLFIGRTDVYAVRWEAKNGKFGYSPACKHEWKPTICQKPNIKCSECQYRELLPLTDQVIYDHLTGKHIIGLYPLLQNETCWFLAVDFDKKNWQMDALTFIKTCNELNVPACIERSRSGDGCHVWIFFQEPLPAYLVRKLGNELISRTLEKRYELGMDSFDRLFPNQDTLPKGGFGNLIALPLQHGPRKNGNSVFVDENFIPYQDQWSYLSNIKKMKLEDVNKIIKTSHQREKSLSFEKETIQYLNKETQNFPIKLKVIESNGLCIEKKGLPSSLIHKLIQLATFKNPEFFKAQAKRLSTHGIPRNITCSEETDDLIILPRGCKVDLEALLNQYSIKYNFQDLSNVGKKILLTFIGELRTEQDQAVEKLLENPIGILSATTGFGKTVIAAELIAKREVNTLIIVHRKQLLEQWKERLSTFLDLENNKIGQIGGGKNKRTGIIDIATIQSLNYKGEVKELVTEYGQIIVDECHHISAYSFEQVLKKANAKYICGLTATPTRKDGLQPIMKMQLGPIRYKVIAKDQAKVRPFEHILLPKYTNFTSNSNAEEKEIQSLYKEIIHDQKRNQMIFDDVLMELDNGAIPLIITERVEHVHYLESKFKKFAKNIIVLTGGMSKQEEKEKRKKLEGFTNDDERLIIATGKYIGEGFDHARLDTLFLVMPLSWKGTLQQYVGRLHRVHDNKSKIKVIDYVDYKEPILKAMFNKRMKGYNSMGYRIIETESNMNNNTEQMKFF